MRLLVLIVSGLALEACLGFHFPSLQARFKSPRSLVPGDKNLLTTNAAATATSAVAPAARSFQQGIISKATTGFNPISAGIGAVAILILSLFPKLGNLIFSIFQRINLKISIANLLIPFAQALGNNFIARFILQRFVLKKKLVLPNTFIPDDIDNRINEFFALNGVSSFELIQLLAAVTGPIGKIKGDKKSTSNALRDFQKKYVETAIKPIVLAPQLLPDDYHYFGTTDSIANLETFVRHNAFFAACLTSSEENGAVVFKVDPKASQPTWFSRFSALLDPEVARIKAEFDANLNLVAIGEYSGNTFRAININSPEADEAASKLLYLMTYTAENIHATTHVNTPKYMNSHC